MSATCPTCGVEPQFHNQENCDQIKRSRAAAPAPQAEHQSVATQSAPKFTDADLHAKIASHKSKVVEIPSAAEAIAAADRPDNPYVKIATPADRKRLEQARIDEQVKKHALVVHDFNDYVKMEFPKRETLIKLKGTDTPLFVASSINQIFAWRGTGKSMLAAKTAITHATGGEFLNWQATRPARTLYLDGEMPDDQVKDRLLMMTKNVGIEPGYLRLVTVSQQNNGNGIPSLATPLGQRCVEDALGDTEVLVLDSISTLTWFSTNEEEEWIEFLAWLNRLRHQRKLSITFLHHAGKSGMQRGHSRSEDLLDLSLKLTRDPGDEAEYCKFQLHYDKVRGMRDGIRDLEVSFQNRQWSYQLVEAARLEILRKYRQENPKASLRTILRDVGPDLGFGPNSVAALRNLLRKVEPEQPEPAEEKPEQAGMF